MEYMRLIQYYKVIKSIRGQLIQMGFNFSQQSKTQSIGKFKNQQLQNVANQFCLERQEVVHLYSCFSSFQSTPQAYLTLDDIAQSLHDGDNHYSELPYLQRLFTIVSRKEYLTGISTFCLMNGEAILHFVFDWLDKDGDGLISREDIVGVLAYENPKTKEKTFLCDFLPDLDKVLQKQQLSFQSFRQMSNKLLFIIWPAYQLQERLRERNLGAQFWQNLYLKIDKAEQGLRNKEKTTKKTQQKIILLKQMKSKKKKEPVSIKQRIGMRIPHQPSTDFQLLQTDKPKRKNSCPYIKVKLTNWQFNLFQEKQDYLQSSKNDF